MEFVEFDEPEYTSDPYYDLFDGGGLKPEKLLTNQEDIDKVNDAIEVIREFLSDGEDAGAIEID